MKMLAILTMLKAISAQFLKQPDSGTVFVPVQDQVTFTCSVEEEYVIDWRVAFINGEEGDASLGIVRTILLQRGFTLEGLAMTRSTLSLRETEIQTNNGTNITCLAHHTGVQTLLIIGNKFQVIFYGISHPPTIQSVMENETGFLISWSLGFIEGVSVNYTLTVLNLNTTSAQPIIIAGLLDQHYVFETSRLCDVYSFTVTAVTAAGNSTPSQEIIFTRIRQTCSLTNATTTITTAEDEIQTTSSFISSTMSSLPREEILLPLRTLSQDTLSTNLPQDNSTTTLIITVSVVVATVMTVLVMANMIVCVFCHKKAKAKPNPNTDPVYETPEDVMPSSAKRTETPFVMTASSAYELQTLPLSKILDTECSMTPFVMTPSSAYEVSSNFDAQYQSTASADNMSKNLQNSNPQIPTILPLSSKSQNTKDNTEAK